MEFVGTIHSIGELENVNGPSSYTKRPFYVKYNDSKSKEQIVRFVFYEPQLNVINNFQINDRVKINFDFKGLISQKTGKFFEEKVANSVDLHEDNKGKKSNISLPDIGQIKPDFTRSYDEFPEELIY